MYAQHYYGSKLLGGLSSHISICKQMAKVRILPKRARIVMNKYMKQREKKKITNRVYVVCCNQRPVFIGIHAAACIAFVHICPANISSNRRRWPENETEIMQSFLWETPTEVKRRLFTSHFRKKNRTMFGQTIEIRKLQWYFCDFSFLFIRKQKVSFAFGLKPNTLNWWQMNCCNCSQIIRKQIRVDRESLSIHISTTSNIWNDNNCSCHLSLNMAKHFQLCHLRSRLELCGCTKTFYCFSPKQFHSW